MTLSHQQRLTFVVLVLLFAVLLRNFTCGNAENAQAATDLGVDEDDAYEELPITTTAESVARIGNPQPQHPIRHRHHHARSKSSHWNQVMQDVKKANEHYLRIRKEAPCKDSSPRVIRVKDIYPDTSKEYLPRCTILHRCSNDVGCCDHDTMQCVAKSTLTVHLYFYTLHLNTEGGAVSVGTRQNTIERLPFVNHTECECVIINDRPRVGPASQQHRSRCPACPGEFNVREHSNGGCSCDCFERQKVCLRQKRGRENFPEEDRRCVESGRCNHPDCEYGHYDIAVGRCPRKHERRNTNTSQQNHAWWRMDEQD